MTGGKEYATRRRGKTMNQTLQAGSTSGLMPEATPDNLEQAISFYRDHGFVRVREMLSQEEAAHFRNAALEYSQSADSYASSEIFQQLVSVWQDDETLRALTLSKRIGNVAERLAGVPLRLWHDHLLIKQPGKSKATEFHQDQPYWPHENSTQPISCWIALQNVPVERGCMTFLPGSHRRVDLPAQSLNDDKSLFGICPELQWSERVTVPLRAGDCTFHHGRCAHMATPNFTDEARVAHVIIFMDEATKFSGKPHVVTNPLELKVGAPLDGELFPRVADFA
jgi:ectoine hydroxylase-related dioxygenase (phytanoyl-CoA dioxygenase family)